MDFKNSFFCLQVNGHDMTVVTHKKAVEYIKRKPVLNMLVYRKGVPPLQKAAPLQAQYQHQQFQQFPAGSYSPVAQHSPQPQFQRNYWKFIPERFTCIFSVV